MRTVVVRRFAYWRLAKIGFCTQVFVNWRFPGHGTVSAKTIVTHALMQSQDEAVLRRSEDTRFGLVRFRESARGVVPTKRYKAQALRLDLSRVCFPGASPPIRERVS